MGKSIFVKKDSEVLEYDEKTWVVTVLNTGSRFGGHSVIVVEGLKRNPALDYLEGFVGQYDIKFEYYAVQTSSFNIKGYVSSVDIFESQKTTRDYSQYTFKSYLVDAVKAQEMIRSIKLDKGKVTQLKRMIKSGEILKENIDSHFIQQHGFLEYQLMGKSSLLADEGAGDNCAGWSLAKLAMAGIGDGSGKPIPQKIAGGWCLVQ